MDKMSFMKNWSARQIYGPTEGLVFYNKLRTLSDIKNYQIGGSVSFSVVNGIVCLCLGKSSAIRLDSRDLDLPTGSSERTLSVWAYQTTSTQSIARGYLAYGYGSGIANANFGIGKNASDNRLMNWAHGNNSFGFTISNGIWTNIVMTFKNNTENWYENGNKKTTTSHLNIDTQNVRLDIGDNVGSGSPGSADGGSSTCYLASPRIYNRVLADSEIAILANEFHPTSGGKCIVLLLLLFPQLSSQNTCLEVAA